MAKVSLRIYNREIESLIDQGHTDEAIAHCRHILQTFPKHLETYRLLGKAYLEAKRGPEAIDVFGRVLMAVPDDFVSHVGMGIIRDDEGKLDDAIWHMERAFEAQPSNAAIQGELQRMYGRRDGMEPPKIRMTRGALAHMYVQGELYPQAISEIRAVLNQDPQRGDMQILLARAFFRGGQKADASDMCAQLLKRYPYCFDANRILVELLPGSERAENTQVYRHRIYELDPYATFAKESVFRSSEVPDASINLERLEYSGQVVDVAQDWGSSLGIGLAAAAASSVPDVTPDWLKSGWGESQPVPAPASQETPAPTAAEAGDIPDFLREAGWTESNGAAESPVIYDESPAADALTPATIPDWLKGQMPSDAALPAESPDWLGDLKGAPGSSTADVPDWLNSLAPDQPAEPAPAASSSEQVPEWLGDLGSGHPAEPAPSTNLKDVPDWLSGLDAGQLEPLSESKSVPSAEDDMPDWLSPGAESATPEPKKTIPPQPEAPKAEPASLDTLGTSAKEQDDAVAWLEMLAAKHGAKPEELVTDPNARTETPPEWVEQARSLGESQPVASPPAAAKTPEPEIAAGDATGMWLRDLNEKDTGPLDGEAISPARKTPDWLSGMESETPAPAPDQGTMKKVGQETAPQKANLPDWLSGLQDESAGSKFETEETPAPQADISDWLNGLDKESASSTGTGAEVESAPSQRTDVPDWLGGLNSQPVLGVEDGETGLREPRIEQFPSELSGMDQSVSAKPGAADLPEWLRGLDEAEPSRPEQAREEIPSWLQGDFEEEEPQPEPTSSSDWHPVEPESAVRRPEVDFESRQPVSKPVVARAEFDELPPPDIRKPAPRTVAAKKIAPKPKSAGESAQVGVSSLSQAQAEMNRGDIPAALGHYNKLIKKGRYLEEITRDLRDSIYRYPVEVNIWQALGDAYMRANRLQEALDAYNKAEELLR